MVEKPTSPYIFVIDTDTYAGNFERELCAFVTGCVGECNVGLKQARQFREAGHNATELFGANIDTECDDHGCARPCSIYPTPGWYNDGYGEHYKEGTTAENGTWNDREWPAYLSVGIFFSSRPTKEQIELMKARAALYMQDKPADGDASDAAISWEGPANITGFRLIQNIIKHDIVEEKL